jgi:excisionase family DNA binding protein
MMLPSTPDNDDALWNARDVAQYLKVSRSWVYHRAEAGELPCLRIGALLRFVSNNVRPSCVRGVVG